MGHGYRSFILIFQHLQASIDRGANALQEGLHLQSVSQKSLTSLDTLLDITWKSGINQDYFARFLLNARHPKDCFPSLWLPQPLPAGPPASRHCVTITANLAGRATIQVLPPRLLDSRLRLQIRHY